MVAEINPGLLGVPPATGQLCFKYAGSPEKLFEHWPQICLTISGCFVVAVVHYGRASGKGRLGSLDLMNQKVGMSALGQSSNETPVNPYICGSGNGSGHGENRVRGGGVCWSPVFCLTAV